MNEKLWKTVNLITIFNYFRSKRCKAVPCRVDPSENKFQTEATKNWSIYVRSWDVLDFERGRKERKMNDFNGGERLL